MTTVAVILKDGSVKRMDKVELFTARYNEAIWSGEYIRAFGILRGNNDLLRNDYAAPDCYSCRGTGKIQGFGRNGLLCPCLWGHCAVCKEPMDQGEAEELYAPQWLTEGHLERTVLGHRHCATERGLELA